MAGWVFMRDVPCGPHGEGWGFMSVRISRFKIFMRKIKLQMRWYLTIMVFFETIDRRLGIY